MSLVRWILILMTLLTLQVTAAFGALSDEETVIAPTELPPQEKVTTELVPNPELKTEESSSAENSETEKSTAEDAKENTADSSAPSTEQKVPVSEASKFDLSSRKSKKVELNKPEKMSVKDALESTKLVTRQSRFQEDTPGRTVYVRMGAVEDAKFYEVQVQPYKQAWRDPFVFKTIDTNLRFRMQPGRYKLRARAYDTNRKPGTWGEWHDFWVPIDNIKPLYPAHGELISPKGNTDEVVTFEWPKVKKAKFYRFNLYNEQGVQLSSISTKSHWHMEPLKLGKVYKWTIIPMLSDTEPENIAPVDINMFAIANAPLDTIPVQIGMEKRALVETYEFELVEIFSENNTSEPSAYHSREPIFRSRLKPGKYELRVRNHYNDGTTSHWGPPKTFFVRIPAPEPLEPKGGKFISASDDENAKVRFSWKPAEDAYQYRVTVFDEDGAMIKEDITKDNYLVITLPHDKKFKWQVIAEHPMQVLGGENITGGRSPASSNTPTNEFEIGHYIKLDLAKAEEPSQAYAWGRWVGSMVQYKTENYDNNNIVSQNIFAGTGELAAGYWHKNTGLGLLAVGQLSGFQVYGDIHNFSSFSLMAGQRYKLDDGKRLRAWLGVSYRETPEVVIDGATRDLSFRDITNFGPELKLSLAGNYKGPYGYQLLGNFYLGSNALDTPNGNTQVNFFSYSLGAYGTYRTPWGPTVMGGYTFQVDQAGYNSYDRTGGINRVYYSGHYMSIFVQYGLMEPER